MRFKIEDFDDPAMDAIVYLEEAAGIATSTKMTLTPGQALILLLAHYLRSLDNVLPTSPPVDPSAPSEEREPDDE